MTSTRTRRWGACLRSRLERWLVALLLASFATMVHADVLVLRDGKALRGEVVRETRREVTFRTREGETWTTKTFLRGDIDKLYDEPGDQADGPVEVVPVREGDDGVPDEEPVHPSGGGAVVVPLHGQVGGLIDGSVARTFDAEVLRAAFEEALRRSADVVVLDIDSHGGYIVEMEAICDVIVDHHDRLRIVAFPDDALSAASIIALSCREMVVREDTLIGAAVMIDEGEDGSVTAVEAKRASPHHARQRQFLRSSGRPETLVGAMSIQEEQLWYSPTRGLAASTPTDVTDAVRVDGPNTVLTMTGDDAITWGLAKGPTRDVRGVLVVLGLDRSMPITELDQVIESYLETLDTQVAQLLRDTGVYFRAVGATHEALGATIDALERGAGADDPRDRAEEAIRTAARARQAMERMDRRIVARRAELPEAFDEQLAEDGRKIPEIRAAIATESVDEHRRAREIVAAMLEGWRELLSP